MPAAPCSFCGSTEGPDHICPGQNLQLIGQVLDGRYKIEDVLGQGGMGMVFKATQISVQRTVALKTLHPALAAAPQFFERFKREAEMASRLRHPNIITIFDFGRTQDGTCYYVMELLEGDSLKGLVKREGPLSLGRAVSIIEQAARALGHAHAGGAIHRDVKPHNMMVQRLDQKDFVKVLDFGLVKAMEQDENQQLTSTGQVLGTPQYMPPEQAGGEVVDQRSDLYSLAGVFYFCLTGASPFGANTVRKALQASLTQSVPPVAKKRNGAPVPHAVDEFFRKGLAREKEDRYQDADEFIAELQAAVSGLSQAEMDALPLPGDPSASSREGSGSSGARDKGTVASRKGSGSQSRASRPSNVVVAPDVDRQPSRAGSGSRSQSASVARAPVPTQKAPSGGGGKIALVVGVPLVAALAIGGWIVFSGKSGPKPSPIPRVEVVDDAPIQKVVTPIKPTANSDVTVHFESEPAGAGIYEGEAQLGTTPTDMRLERSKALTLTFKLAGHQPVERSLDLSRLAEDRATIHVALKKVDVARPVAQPAGGTRKKPQDEPIPVFE